jgi:hypothetical protein
MTINDAIDQLTESALGHNDRLNQELIVAWWDKQTVEFNADTTLTDEEWLNLIEHADYKMDWSSVNDTFMDIIEEMRSNT